MQTYPPLFTFVGKAGIIVSPGIGKTTIVLEFPENSITLALSGQLLTAYLSGQIQFPLKKSTTCEENTPGC
jgi:hypothetical protein